MTHYFQNFFTNRINNNLILFEDEEHCYSVKQLKMSIFQLAKQLTLYPQKHWAICTENQFWFTASFFALLYLSKTPVILGHTQEKKIKEQQTFFEGAISDFKILLPEKIVITLPIEDNERIEHLEAFFAKQISSQKVLFFTSGSSGTPQKIEKKFEILEKESEILLKTFYSKIKNSHFISTVSPLHQYGISFSILLPLRARGCSSNVLPITYQEELLKKASHKNITLITSPAFLKRLDMSLLSPHHFCAIFSAGGPLSNLDADETFQTFKTYPIEIYGSSETCVIAFRKFLSSKKNIDSALNFFKPFPGIFVSPAANNLIEVNSPLISEKSMILQDKVQFTEHGFTIIGRSDKIIKLEEKRISLTEIERRIEKILLGSKVFIIPLTQGKRTILGAVITYKDNANSIDKNLTKILRNALKDVVEPVAIPRKWRFTKDIPLNSQGKVTYQSLKDLFYE